MQYTPEQLLLGAQAATAAGDLGAAKELLDMRKAMMGGQDDPAAPQTPKQPGFMDLAGKALTDIPMGIMNITGGASLGVAPPETNGFEQLGSGIEAAVGAAGAAVPGVIRYAPPIAAGILTSRLGPGVMSGVGLTVAGASEQAAQAVEKFFGLRSEMNPREVASSAILGANVPLKLSSGILNFLANTGENVALSEVARFAEKGKFEKPTVEIEDVLTRFGIPVGMGTLNSILSGRNKAFSEGKDMRDAISAERKGGSVVLSEIDPKYTKLTANVIANGNKYAAASLSNMDENIGNVLARAYENAPNQSQIAAELAPYVGQLKAAQDAAIAARDNAGKLAQEAQEAIVAGRSNAVKLKEDARQAAMKASQTAYVYQEGVERMFGGSSQKIGTILSGASKERLQGVAQAAKDSIESGLDRIYADVGIGLNDTVVTAKNIRNSAEWMSAERLPLEGKISRTEFLTTLDKSLATIADESGNISLEGYRKFRDVFARNLAQSTNDVTYANRVASGSYNVVKDAANMYIVSARPNVYGNWQFANAAAADLYRTKATNAIDLIVEGNTDGLIKLFRDAKTATPIMNEINSYAAAIEGMGGKEAKTAANGFKRDVMATIRDGVVAQSLHTGTGQDLSGRIIDWNKLITTVDDLRQRKFPVDLLDLGDAKDIKQLARVASAGGDGGMTVDQFEVFLRNRRNLGAGAAIARHEWFNAYRDFMIGGDVKNQANKAARLGQLAKAAKLEGAALDQAVLQAQQDPVIALFHDTNMGLSRDPSKNTNFIGSLFSMNPDLIERFTNSLKTSGRGAVLEDIKVAASADVFNNMFQKVEDASAKRIKLSSITDFFDGPANENRRNVLRTIVGDDEYRNIQKNLVVPIQRILKEKNSLISAAGERGNDIRAIIVGGGIVSQKTTGGAIVSNAFNVMREFVDNQRYNALHLLYVNPSTADAFAKAAYNLDKFVASNAANSMALRMAINQDADNAAANKPAPKR